jgi:hypothetical protein
MATQLEPLYIAEAPDPTVQQQPTEPIMLGGDVAPPMPPAPAVADLRAEKATMGLGATLKKEKKDIYGDIVAGHEEALRQQAASQLNFEHSIRKQQQVIDLANKKGGPITQEEYARILDPFLPSNKPADPKDVIERAYATSFISAANTAKGVVADAAQEIPEQKQQIEQKATEAATKIQFARTLGENLDTEITQQGWVPWLADQAKTMFQPYNEIKMRGLNPEVGKLSGGVLLGDNMKEQADELFMRPMDEYKAGLLKIVTELRKDNPTLARQFIDYVQTVGPNDRKLQNIFTILSPLDYAQGLNLGKAAVRKIDVYNRTNKAFKDLVVASAKTGEDGVPGRAIATEVAGNNGEAAVIRAADSVAKDLNGKLDPVLDVKEKLTSNFRLDGDLLDSNPGSLSRTQMTILKDSFANTATNLYDTIMNALRVNRTPIPLASEDALRAYREMMKSKFPGLDNAILDIGSPIYEPHSNTYHIPVTFGNHNGDLFSSIDVARSFAQRYGFADIRVMDATGRVEISPATFKGSKTDLATKARLEKSLPETERVLKEWTAKARDRKNPDDVRADAKERVKSIKAIIKQDQEKLTAAQSRLTLSDAVIQQEGNGYKFVVVKPYNETDETVRSFLISQAAGRSTASAEGFNSWKNSVLGWVRGSEDTLALNESMQRKVATYTQSLFKKWALSETKDIEAVANQFKWNKPRTWLGAVINNKQMFQEFNETLKFGKTPHPETGERGWFFKTPGDLEDHYMRFYRRLPTFAEQKAYFAHVKLTEGNRVLSEIAEFRNRSRLGAEQHQISVMAGKGMVQSGFFDGIQQNVFPGGKDQILIMGGRKGDERLYNLGANNIPGKDLERYRDQVKTGQAKIIRIYDPDAHPLQDFSEVAGRNRVRYVMVYNHESKPLDFNHVNRRGGGHFDVDSPFYIKQANMVEEMAGSVANDKRKLYSRTYTGDNTLMPIQNSAMGKDIATKMNTINRFMAEGRVAEAEQFVRTANLGIEWDEVRGWYTPKKLNGKDVPARINPHEPFYVVPKNRQIIDLGKDLQNRHGDLFRDGTKSGSDARQFQVAYNQERNVEDLYTLKDEGSQGNPIYKYVPAEYADPIPTMNRALARAINSTFMDDYKLYAVEHWLQEAIPHMKVDPDEVMSAPFYYFNNTSERGAFTAATADDVKWNLLSNRFKINQFLGTPSKIDTAIHGLTQLLVNDLYTKLGPLENRGAVGKAIEIIPLWALSRATDPVSTIRSLAFNAKLGLFSLPQLLVQAQTYTSIIALEPRRGMAGTYAAMLHQWSRVNSNPAILNALDNYASKLNMFGSKWRPGEWLEARLEMGKTGFEHVGGEYSMADDVLSPKFIRNEWGNFLDAGQIFFREGERSTRLGAYYTAFREFRDLNPARAITNADRAAILQKADLLTTNMSRASASVLHGGVLSLTTQFLSYQLRMAEMFIGKRIGDTVGERALARGRLVMMYAGMYGVPSALGISGYPFGDSIREAAINRGYVVGDKFLSSLMMEGVPSLLLAMATGGGDMHKGNFYNVGDRYGSQGFTSLRESLRSDNTMWKIFGGAGGSILMNSIGSLDPFWQAARNLMSDDEEHNTFKLTGRDFVNLFNEISSVDAAQRMWFAMNTGKWMSKNESYMTDVSALNATFMASTGLKPQQQDDVFTLHNIKDTEEKAQKAATALIIKDYQRAIQANVDNDPDLSKALMSRARARTIAAGIPLDKRADIYSAASRGYQKRIETSVWDWATKNVPAGEEANRIDALTRSLQLNNLRNP